MTEWRYYQPGDLHKAELLEEREHILQFEDVYERMAAKREDERWFMGTCLHNGRIMFMGGWMEVAPGVAEGFFMPTEWAKQNGFLFARAARRWLAHMEKLPWCHRIQSHSLPLPHIEKWMISLGFIAEGTLRRYTEDGLDYQLWSRVKKDGLWRNL